MLTSQQVNDFNRNGYIVVRTLFDTEEMDLLREMAKNDQALEVSIRGLRDGEGGVQKISLWNEAGDDIYGLVARSRRVVDAMEQLLGGEVYHYHSKMSIKEPFTGGAWAWHQDYGYWYHNNCLFPDMASAFIAVDANTKENGCMQVLRGSHRMGRIEHGTFGDQTGADPERTTEATKRLELVHAVMEPGDTLFFHSNTLHRSDQNKSPDPRWSMICCYNAASNNPYKESHHPSYTPLKKVDDAELKRMGTGSFASGTKFWAPSDEQKVPAKKD